MKRSFFLLAAIAGLFFACVHQVIIPPIVQGGGGGNDSTGGGGGGDSIVCFEGEILPIFISSCAYSGCHDSKSKEEGYVLDTWKNITKKGIVPGNANSSKIYQEIASGNMPPAGNLTGAQINRIALWIEQGANNTTNCNSCDTSIFTYKAVAGIMTTNCTSCHSASNLSAGIDLSTYTGVSSAAVSGRLVGAVTHAPGYIAMPQGGSLTDCNITQIEKWVAAGAPNN